MRTWSRNSQVKQPVRQALLLRRRAKSAADSAKRHVIDEVTKPVKKAAKDKLSAMTSGIKAKAVQKLERKK